MRRLRIQGFTFIELMIAVSIFAVVSVAIYATFNSGLSAWKKAEQSQNICQDVRLALEKMALDLENAVIYSPDPEFSNFEGKNNKISFYSLKEVFQTIPSHLELRKITYALDESTQTLQRWEENFAQSAQETTVQEPEDFATQIKTLAFSYCYEDEGSDPLYQWKDEWDAVKEIPQGVKIELEVGAEKLTFTKYVFIPTGKKGKE